MSASTDSRNGIITLRSYPRAILHVDCDSFFTSCEVSRCPSLKGRPLATGKERGIVSCPSYEAKARGVKRGMRIGEARKACPDIIIMPSDYELYSIYSSRMFDILRRFTPQVEEYSIDEAFCDLTGLRRRYRTSYSGIAAKIKESVSGDLGITVSIGLSLTKTLAKICSKENKPDGFTALPGNMIHEFLKDKPVERVCGFGPNTSEVLNKYGVHTALDYIRRPISFADRLIGKIGREIWHELRGEQVYAVADVFKAKHLSISKTKTFSPPSGDPAVVKSALVRNLESALIKLRRHDLIARSLLVILRKKDFSHAYIDGRLGSYSSSPVEFTNICARLFSIAFEAGVEYRATGVVLSDIICRKNEEMDLFEDKECMKKRRSVGKLVDDINGAYGKHTIHMASSAYTDNKSEHPRNIPAWRKTHLLKGENFRRRIGIPLLDIRSDLGKI